MADRAKVTARKQAVLVEIGSDWVKLLQVEALRGGPAVTKAFVQPINGLDDSVGQALCQAHAAGKFARIPVIACVPRQMVNIRTLELPSNDPDEIADMVDLQSGKQTPYSREEIVCDYRILDSQRDGYSRVMLVIVQRSVLRQRFHLLEVAGLDVERMTVSTEGLLGWSHAALTESEQEEVTAVLDVDSFYAELALLQGGQLLVSRSILMGANELMQDFTRWGPKFVREAATALEAFREEVRDRTAARMVVTGAGPRVVSLTEALAEATGLEVQALSAEEVVQGLPPELDFASGEEQVLSITALLGMAREADVLQFALVPDSVALRRNLERKSREFTKLGIALMLLLLTGSFYVSSMLALHQRRLQTLAEAVAEKQPAVESVNRMLDIVKTVRERRDSRLATVNLLGELHRMVPSGVFLESAAFDLDKPERQVTLTGSGADRRDIRSLVQNLEQSILFRDAAEGGQTTRDRDGRFKFQVVCSLGEE